MAPASRCPVNGAPNGPAGAHTAGLRHGAAAGLPPGLPAALRLGLLALGLPGGTTTAPLLLAHALLLAGQAGLLDHGALVRHGLHGLAARPAPLRRL